MGIFTDAEQELESSNHLSLIIMDMDQIPYSSVSLHGFLTGQSFKEEQQDQMMWISRAF